MTPSESLPSAEDYSHLPRAGQGLVAAFRTRVVELVVAETPKRILEVGCGQGWLLKLIAEAVPDADLHGLDIRPEVIEYARQLVPSARLVVGDGQRLPYDDGSFDLVVCSEVLEHVDDPAAVLAEIERVGRGTAVLSVPHEPWFWGVNLIRGKHLATLGNCAGHIHHWTKRGFARLLQARYAKVTVQTSFPWLIALVRR